MSLQQFLPLLLALFFASAWAVDSPTGSLAAPQQNKTLIESQDDYQKLLGQHRFSLQWISWTRFGKATVRDEGGLLRIQGRQTGNDEGGEAGKDDFVSMDGVITEVRKNQFIFRGKILTKVYYINQGQVCERNGEMTFSVKSGRKYWRLQEMDNPCSQVVDYVDIFFRR